MSHLVTGGVAWPTYLLTYSAQIILTRVRAWNMHRRTGNKLEYWFLGRWKIMNLRRKAPYQMIHLKDILFYCGSSYFIKVSGMRMPLV